MCVMLKATQPDSCLYKYMTVWTQRHHSGITIRAAIILCMFNMSKDIHNYLIFLAAVVILQKLLKCQPPLTCRFIVTRRLQ